MLVLKEKIEKLFNKVLPSCAYRNVAVYQHFTRDDNYLAIFIAASDYNINNVRGQKPQCVSLSLEKDLTLKVSTLGGMGGGRINLIPDRNNPDEAYLAIAGKSISFRSPKKAEENVLQAIERFALRWLELMRENEARLMYKDIVNYNELLK